MSGEQKIIVDACCHVKDAHIKGRSSTGKSACGVLIVDSFDNEHEFSKYLGEKTVPQAEFEGLVFALDKACEILMRTKNVEVWMDSELVVKWMNKEYRLKQDHIKPIFQEQALEKIVSLSEQDITKKFLIPLFGTFGFNKVDYHGGPYEGGKDIICWRLDELGLIELAVAQVKKYKPTSAAS